MHRLYILLPLATAFLLNTCKGEEWRPINRRPTHEYVAPTMDRVHYWQRRPPTSSMEFEQPPPLRISSTNGAHRQQPVPPFMLLPPSLKDSSYLHLWSARDEPSVNNVDDTPWKWKDTSGAISSAAASSSHHLNEIENMAPPPLPSQQPLPLPQMITTPPTTTTTQAPTRATTQATTTSTEDPTVNLVEPLQLIIEGHSKVRKYGVTYLPFELAQRPVFKQPEKEEETTE